MYSITPYSVLPFADDGLALRAYINMDFSVDVEFSYTIYVSSRAGYATLPTDTLRSQPFRGVLQSYSFERSILQSNIGEFTTGGGQLVILNTDAYYDFLPDTYTIDARPINLKVGRTDKSYNTAFTLAKLTSTGWNVDIDQITIDLVDFSYKLSVPMQTNTYGGTGGIDGTADMVSKRKSLLFGYCREVSPVSLVPSYLIYQLHDGSVQSIDNVYDRGLPLTYGGNYSTYAAMLVAYVPPGYFITCRAVGMFKLGSTPGGTVTADCHGENGSGYLETTADIILWAIKNKTSILDPNEIDYGSFSNLNAQQPAPINFYFGPDDTTTVAAFISNVMGGIGGWGGFTRNGQFAVKIFYAPVGTKRFIYTRDDMVGGELNREALPSAYRPPPWRWRVPYQQCWTVQTDLAGNITADHKAFVSQEFRLAEAANSLILQDHPFAQDPPPIVAYFTNQSDAAAEALRRLNLFKSSNSIYRFKLPRRALQHDIGEEIEIIHPRFDLVAGRDTIIVEMKENVNFAASGGVDTVEVAVYG